ncbi:META domain-containing protein [Desulfocastanea catecholica]
MLNLFRYCIVALFMLTLPTSCSEKMSAQWTGVDDITGAWVRPIPGGTGVEGFFLHPDGSLRLINIFSMQGNSWSLNKDKLTLFTHTERYPQPVADIHTIQIISADKMVLARQDVKIEYRRPATGKNLMATRWVASYVPGMPAEAKPEQEVYFTMRHDGRIEGFAGCNTFSGPYMVSGETVKIGPLISTRMFCPAMAVEDNLFRILGSSDEFLIVEDQLYLYNGNFFQGFFKAK